MNNHSENPAPEKLRGGEAKLENPAPEIEVGSQLVSGATVVAYTQTTLLICTGHVSEPEAKEVLFPVVEMRFLGQDDAAEGKDDGEELELFSGVLTLDNAASTISEVCEDLAEICRQTRQVGGGELRMEASRIEATKSALNEAKESLVKCLAELEKIEGV